MGAKEGNQNARKAVGARVPVCLSIADERKAWVIKHLQSQGIKELTQADIIRFVKDLCYKYIDNQIKMEEQYHADHH